MCRVMPSGEQSLSKARILSIFYIRGPNAWIPGLPAGQYDFVLEIDPRNPTRPLSGSTLDADNRLVFRLNAPPFQESNVAPSHPLGKEAKGCMNVAVILDPRNGATRGKTKQWPDIANYFGFLRAVYPMSYKCFRWTGEGDPLQSNNTTGPFPDFDPLTNDGDEEAFTPKIQAYLDGLNEAFAKQSRPLYTHAILFTDRMIAAGLGQCGTNGGVMDCRGRSMLVNLDPTRNTPEAVAFPDGAIAHEIGHNFGFGDTYVSENNVKSPNSIDDKTNCILVDDTSGCVVEEGNLDTQRFQTAIRVSNYPGAPQNGGLTAFQKFEFMGKALGGERWVNLRSWNTLYPLFNQPLPAVGTSPQLAGPKPLPRDSSSDSPADLITILATVDSDGNGALLHTNRWQGTMPDYVIPAGQYTISILDAGSNVLLSQSFGSDDGSPNEDGTPASITMANVTLPFPPGAAQIVLANGGAVLATQPVSPNAPLVQLVAPSGAGPLDGTVDMFWNASDPDGDPLTYSVFYSPDNGDTWTTLAANLTSNSFDWDTTQSAGTQNGLLMISASDGVNVSYSQSASSFAVVNKPPFLSITSPADGANIDLTTPFVFQASIYDLQDGEALGQISWTSDRDGTLGTGAFLPAPQLSPGVHHITATGTNQNGLTASASISITVPVNQIAPRIDSVSPSNPAAGAAITITGANFDSDPGYDKVTLGGAAAQVTAATSTSLTVTLPAGLPNGPVTLTVAALGLTSLPFTLTIGQPAIAVFPTTLSFSNVITGQSATQTLSVSNTGNADLNVSSITSDNRAFTASPTSFTVHAGASQNVSVQFAAGSLGLQGGNLIIASNDAASPLKVPVSGTSIPVPAPSIAVSPTTLSFASVTTGKSATQTLAVSNSGNADLNVSSITSDNGAFTVSLSSFAVHAGALQNVNVQFTAGALGSAKAAT